MESLLARVGKLRLFALTVKSDAFRTEPLSACSLFQVFPLNVVPGIAIRIIVIYGGFYRMPWCFLRHCSAPVVICYGRSTILLEPLKVYLSE